MCGKFWCLAVTFDLLLMYRSCFKWSGEEQTYHSQICSSLKMDIERTNRRVNQVCGVGCIVEYLNNDPLCALAEVF